MLTRMTKPALAALTLSLGLSLAGCASDATSNRSLDSIKQPVVDRSNFSLDVDANGGGLSIAEQRRLDDWFSVMDLGYGDRVSIDDPLASRATRQAVADIAARYGLLVSDGAPVTNGLVNPGKVRVVVTRSKATVPGCPDWEGSSSFSMSNSTHSGYGCAVNANLAAMVADPEDLIHGKSGPGETVIMTSNKAIDSYRKQKPTGESGLKATSTGSGGN